MSEAKFPVDSIKSKLRAEALQKRLEFEKKDSSKAGLKLRDIFWEEFGSAIKKIKKQKGKCVVSAYMPMQGEIDSKPLMEKLIERDFVPCVPVVEKEKEPLVFVKWNPDMKMEKGLLGVLQPTQGEKLVPDVMIIPLLAFDKECYRLGFGGGYYDKTIEFLRSLEKKPLCYGVAYAGQEIKKVPTEKHDERLDAIITEKFVYKAS